jgi:hypothetical protein
VHYVFCDLRLARSSEAFERMHNTLSHGSKTLVSGGLLFVMCCAGIVSVVEGASGQLTSTNFGLMHPANVFIGTAGKRGVVTAGTRKSQFIVGFT